MTAPEERWEAPTGRRWGRLALVVLAIVAVLIAGGLAVRLPEEAPPTDSGFDVVTGEEPPPAVQPITEDDEDAPRRWQPIAEAPFATDGAVPGVWTGEALFVFTGEQAWSYDPTIDSWTRRTDPPSHRRTGWTATWTGEEVLVWGGVDESGDAPADGLAYRPDTDSWRVLPPAPIAGRDGHAAVWGPSVAGGRLYVWGGRRPRGTGQRYLADGAAYDPDTDAWEQLPTADLTPRAGASVQWVNRTDSRLLVWGGAQGSDRLHDGAVLDVSTGDWTPIPTAPEAFAHAPAVAWSGSRLLVWGLPAAGLGHLPGWAYTLDSGQWQALPRLLQQERANATAVWIPAEGLGALVVWGGLHRLLPRGVTDGFVFDLSGAWRQIPPAPIAAREDPTVVWTGDALLVWGGFSGGAALPDGATYPAVHLRVAGDPP